MLLFFRLPTVAEILSLEVGKYFRNFRYFRNFPIFLYMEIMVLGQKMFSNSIDFIEKYFFKKCVLISNGSHFICFLSISMPRGKENSVTSYSDRFCIVSATRNWGLWSGVGFLIWGAGFHALRTFAQYSCSDSYT